MQGWARVAALLCLLLPLPAVLWRLLMLAGVDVGFAEADRFRGDPAATAYVLTLEAVTVLVGLLCQGLAMPWGERIPPAVPRVGGREIPRRLPLLLGGVGVTVMLVIWTQLATSFLGHWLGLRESWTPDRAMDASERLLLAVCYLPFAAWPFAIIAALVGYERRRRPSPGAGSLRAS